MTTTGRIAEADALADALMAAHGGDALEAHNDARATAKLAMQRRDGHTALIHELAADNIEGRFPSFFVI